MGRSIFHHTENTFAKEADHAQHEHRNQRDDPDIGSEKKRKTDSEAGGESGWHHGELTYRYRWLAKHRDGICFILPNQAEKF
ncbi:hypothetical protein [Methylobacterium sp. 88A]|uniref:hypothetical protein n=1 Tax=Methylobacterium sp. 88A TaxID=1131813 RepID=UPI0012F6B0D9|nr:hypothetical protein [Methylobacterium sp. 88A]